MKIDRLLAVQQYVYDNFLSRPYHDSPDHYQTTPFKLAAQSGLDQYPAYVVNNKGQLVKKISYNPSDGSINYTPRANEFILYRPNHGLAHNMRVTNNIAALVDLYQHHDCGQSLSPVFSSMDDSFVAKLQVAAAFFVAGRGSEAAFQASSETERSPYYSYRHKSAESFLHYVESCPDLVSLFANEKALFKQALEDPYISEEEIATVTPENARLVAIKSILSSAHALDLSRCFSQYKMRKKISEVALPFANQQDTRAVRELFLRNQYCMSAMGQEISTKFDPQHHDFTTTMQETEFKKFSLCSSNVYVGQLALEIAKWASVNPSKERHIQKAFDAFLTDPANYEGANDFTQLSANFKYFMQHYREPSIIQKSIQRYLKLMQMQPAYKTLSKECLDLLSTAMKKVTFIPDARYFGTIILYQLRQGSDSLSSFLKTVLQQSQPRDLHNFLESEAKKIDNEAYQNGYIIKAIGNVTRGGWSAFASGLADPYHSKTELRKINRFGLYTTRLKNNEYSLALTKKALPTRASLHTLQEKKSHTKYQSTTYVNSNIGYTPEPFGKFSSLVGVAIKPADCIFNRMMFYHDPTFHRPYDAAYAETAHHYLQKQRKALNYATNLGELAELGIAKKSKLAFPLNEVMSGLKWSETSCVSIFYDTPESRLLAQLYTADLTKRLAMAGKNFSPNIVFYPTFQRYSPETQAQDISQAANNPNLRAYLDAINYIKTGQTTRYDNTVLRLLTHVNTESATLYSLQQEQHHVNINLNTEKPTPKPTTMKHYWQLRIAKKIMSNQDTEDLKNKLPDGASSHILTAYAAAYLFINDNQIDTPSFMAYAILQTFDPTISHRYQDETARIVQKKIMDLMQQPVDDPTMSFIFEQFIEFKKINPAAASTLINQISDQLIPKNIHETNNYGYFLHQYDEEKFQAYQKRLTAYWKTAIDESLQQNDFVAARNNYDLLENWNKEAALSDAFKDYNGHIIVLGLEPEIKLAARFYAKKTYGETNHIQLVNQDGLLAYDTSQDLDDSSEAPNATCHCLREFIAKKTLTENINQFFRTYQILNLVDKNEANHYHHAAILKLTETMRNAKNDKTFSDAFAAMKKFNPEKALTLYHNSRQAQAIRSQIDRLRTTRWFFIGPRVASAALKADTLEHALEMGDHQTATSLLKKQRHTLFQSAQKETVSWKAYQKMTEDETPSPRSLKPND